MDLSAYGPTFRAVVAMGARLSNWPDAVVCNSEAGIAAHERLGYRPRGFLLIDNGIDTDRFAPDPQARAAVRSELGIPPDAPVVATAARTDRMKDYPNLLAALDRLPEVWAILMGEGTEALSDRPRLLRLGRCGTVPRVLAAGDLIVSASAYGEGFSNAIAEGMACGLPAVATDVGDARRIVGDTGAVVAPRDPAALASAIQDFLAISDRAAAGRAARARIVSEFSLDRTVARFRRLHREGD